MCIALLTTSHPHYPLILLNNRDEYILRPTSRPHWWNSPYSSSTTSILSSRDLQRPERGTWLGITSTGKLAILTNYRENDTHDAAHPVEGSRSRGGMVTAWLCGEDSEETDSFVHRLLEGEGVRGVGGFSLVCGRLRRMGNGEGLEPLAVISNRAGSVADVPWIAGERGKVYGLSNTSYEDPVVWPKVEMGKEKLVAVVGDAVREGLGEERLVERLWGLLDTDTLPERKDGEGFQEYTYQLRKSIFVPSIGEPEIAKAIPQADRIAAARKDGVNGTKADLESELEEEETPSTTTNDTPGVYGTQRQTIVLVDWEGNVTYRERALWDEKGFPIERGKRDVKFEYKIEGWTSNGESKGTEFRPFAML